MERGQLEKYEVIFRDIDSGIRWTALYKADSFAMVEHFALATIKDDLGQEIVQITKDYE